MNHSKPKMCKLYIIIIFSLVFNFYKTPLCTDLARERAKIMFPYVGCDLLLVKTYFYKMVLLKSVDHWLYIQCPSLVV